MLTYTLTNLTKQKIVPCHFKNAINAISKILKIKGSYHFDLTFVSSNKIKSINKKYRLKDKVTDVITFAFNDSSGLKTKLLGEIFICYDQCVKQAKEYGHSIQRELTFLFVHGILHLLQYDHQDETNEKIMIELQDKILKYINLKR